MSMCESDRGEWGKPCPDCGKVLPARQPRMSTWMAERNTDPVRRANAQLADAKALRLKHQPRVRRPRAGEYLTERQQEIVRIVEKHGGDRNAAARELGVTDSNVVTTLTKLRSRGVAVPAPSRQTRKAS